MLSKSFGFMIFSCLEFQCYPSVHQNGSHETICFQWDHCCLCMVYIKIVEYLIFNRLMLSFLTREFWQYEDCDGSWYVSTWLSHIAQILGQTFFWIFLCYFISLNLNLWTLNRMYHLLYRWWALFNQLKILMEQRMTSPK